MKFKNKIIRIIEDRDYYKTPTEEVVNKIVRLVINNPKKWKELQNSLEKK